jgi:hypothetical protein
MLSQLPPSGSLNTGCGMSAAVWIVRSIDDVHSLARTEPPRGSDEPRELHIVSPGVVAKYGSSCNRVTKHAVIRFAHTRIKRK